VPAPLPPRVTVAFGLGGNLGPVEAAFHTALRALAMVVTDLRVASLYRSRAVSPIPQPDFLNTAAVGTTQLAPVELFTIAQQLERQAGRVPGPRYGPRPLDIDLLLYGDLQRASRELTLPHPRLRERRFVLAPLAEVAPTLAAPPDGRTIADLLRDLGTATAADHVERLPRTGGPAS
jgi:2-amino-4-hydroxy-6-hydroxymethyldihydropteridine diphosphokinase